MPSHNRYRVKPGRELRLADYDSDDDGGLEKAAGEAEFDELHARLISLSDLLYADGRHALLVVLQGMDTSGKDSATRAVFSGISPTAINATSFKAPSTLERRHDFLWRIHSGLPPAGEIGIFNRSHYEDVLIVRVQELVPEKRWQARYDHINAFERMLSDEGTVIVKFYLHISQEYQRKRLQRRLDNPEKHWKFNPGDLVQRKRWDDYIAAYEEALSRCSAEHAPWYVVPAEKRWYRNLVMTRVLVNTLELLDLRYPAATFDPRKIVIE